MLLTTPLFRHRSNNNLSKRKTIFDTFRMVIELKKDTTDVFKTLFYSCKGPKPSRVRLNGVFTTHKDLIPTNIDKRGKKKDPN